MQYLARCFAYAYITPAGAACKADPEPFIRRAIHGVVPPALFELLGPSHGADRTVRFRSPDDRESAMEKQPFALDGASVRLVREGETSNVRRVRLDCVALLRYPKEQRNLEDIRRNCTSFGHLLRRARSVPGPRRRQHGAPSGDSTRDADQVFLRFKVSPRRAAGADPEDLGHVPVRAHVLCFGGRPMI
jgi:hypothetical protein